MNHFYTRQSVFVYLFFHINTNLCFVKILSLSSLGGRGWGCPEKNVFTGARTRVGGPASLESLVGFSRLCNFNSSLCGASSMIISFAPFEWHMCYRF